MPDRPATPPTERVTADLRRRLEADEWAHGGQLPSNRELAESYGVSTRTVSKALRALEADGLVTVTPSWGTHRS